MNGDDRIPGWLRAVFAIAITIALLGAPISMVVLLYLERDDAFTRLVEAHPAAMLGVPWAGGAAFVVVLALRPVFGKMEFRALGFEFKGASGPVVLWVLCFLAEVLAIGVLW
jgi:hypothetical protein